MEESICICVGVKLQVNASYALDAYCIIVITKTR